MKTVHFDRLGDSAGIGLLTVFFTVAAAVSTCCFSAGFGAGCTVGAGADCAFDGVPAA